MARLLMQRLSKEREGSVKYSTWCPSRSNSPCEASRAMPINCGLSPRMGRRGRESIEYSPFLRHRIARGRGIVKQACRIFWIAGRREVWQTSPRELFQAIGKVYGCEAGFSAGPSNNFGSTVGLNSIAVISAVFESLPFCLFL